MLSDIPSVSCEGSNPTASFTRPTTSAPPFCGSLGALQPIAPASMAQLSATMAVPFQVIVLPRSDRERPRAARRVAGKVGDANEHRYRSVAVVEAWAIGNER